MAIFSRKTKETKKAETKTAKKSVAKKTSTNEVVVKSDGLTIHKDMLQSILLRPRITEKATFLVEKANTYVFEVSEYATKPLIAKAIKTMYDVSPVKVLIVKTPPKKVFIRGKVGYNKAIKKAYVVLKKDDKIEFA
jgi:large subunit ribosomal protein L23